MTAPHVHPAAAAGFQTAADRYERGRPGYPADAIAHIVRALDLRGGRTLLEIGAGTGKFTSSLMPTGSTVLAVEPVAAMRERLAAACPGVTAIDGTAEAIPLGDATVDAAVVAQAFHWFDGAAALGEIHRVLRRGGPLALVWNVRDETSAWSRALTSLFDELAGPDAPRHRTGRWREAFDATDRFTPLQHTSFSHVHRVSRSGFVDRVLSVSYVASAPSARRDGVVREVERLLDTDPDLAGREPIEMPYTTDVYVCTAR